MTIIRVQYRRTLAGAPLVGKWDVYSNAYFDAASTTPSAPILAGLQNLFTGQRYDGGATTVIGTGPFDLGAGRGLITVWTMAGGTATKVADHVVTVPTKTPASATNIASQLAISMGYKNTDIGGPSQRGRSRFWLGPLNVGATYLTGTTNTGGQRLTTAGVDQLVSNATNAIAGLTAAGWVLQVRSNRDILNTYGDADEIYVDDVFDTMRSRQTWRVYQKRQAI